MVIQSALKVILDPMGVMKAWLAYLKGVVVADDPKPIEENASAFVRTIELDDELLVVAIEHILVDGWLAGLKEAVESGAPIVQPYTGVVNSIDWSTWRPADPHAAELIRNTGFESFLDQEGVRIKGMEHTILEAVGDTLAQSASEGWTLHKTTSAIAAIIGDSKRASRIAATELNRIMTMANFHAESASGVMEWDLVTAADPCPVCVAIKDANPHSITDTNLPPYHPYCRCIETAHVGGPNETRRTK